MLELPIPDECLVDGDDVENINNFGDIEGIDYFDDVDNIELRELNATNICDFKALVVKTPEL